MISVTDLRAGTIYEENGNLLQVLSYEHIKMGRASANIKVKVKNLRSGSTTEKSFINGIDSSSCYQHDRVIVSRLQKHHSFKRSNHNNRGRHPIIRRSRSLGPIRNARGYSGS